jgi:hypothetical protein
MSIGILSWTNETSLSPYPLSKSFGYDNFLVDANFVQFDDFVPVLQSIKLEDDMLTMAILFDSGVVETNINTSYLQMHRFMLKIKSDDRVLGHIVFGPDTNRFIEDNFSNRTTKVLNIPFLASTVKVIPLKSGVFSIDGKFGPLHVFSEEVIWYDVNDNDVTFNAVSGLNYTEDIYLKSLNTVLPISNGVYVEDNQVIKFRSIGAAAIEVSLVGSELTALTKSNAIITTNG